LQVRSARVTKGEYHWHEQRRRTRRASSRRKAFDIARAQERSVILMVENAGIIPTGDLG
jgi:hypothetical protein